MKNLLAFVALAATTSVVNGYPMFNATEDDFRMLGKRAQAQVFTSCTESNAVAMTFDDGPYINHEKVSQTLLKYGAKGTFFVNGNNYDCIYTESVADMLIQSFKDGNQIASHTWSHPHLNTLSADQQATELSRIDTALIKILGVKPAFIRPPYGEYNTQFETVAGNNNQKIVTWNFDSGDSVGTSVTDSEKLYDQKLGANPKPNNLLALNHETEQATVDTLLPYVLEKYGKQYKFVTVAECMGMGAYDSQGSPGTRDASWNCN